MTQIPFICVAWYDLDPWPRNVIQGHCTLFTQRYSVGEVWARFAQGDRRYPPDKGSRTDMGGQTNWSLFGASRGGPNYITLHHFYGTPFSVDGNIKFKWPDVS